MADFKRDIHSLLALGFKAAQLQDIIRAVDNHPNVYFDEVILDK